METYPGRPFFVADSRCPFERRSCLAPIGTASRTDTCATAVHSYAGRDVKRNALSAAERSVNGRRTTTRDRSRSGETGVQRLHRPGLQVVRFESSSWPRASLSPPRDGATKFPGAILACGEPTEEPDCAAIRADYGGFASL